MNESTLRFRQAAEDLEVLTNNVPGGIFRCLYDEKLTLLQVSDGFVSMFGYTREEIKEWFHDHFWEMVDERDRVPTALEVKRQMALGKTKNIEYRVRHKNGNIIWVLDKGQLIEDPCGGCPSFYCIIIDITQEREAQEELRLTLERYDIIMNQTNDIIFEWDIVKDQLKYSRDMEKLFNWNIPRNGVMALFREKTRSILCEEDLDKLKRIYLSILKGESYVEEELRILNREHRYQWWKLRLTVQFDQNRSPIRVIGIILDIDQEKQQSQSLLNRAERDALTGLYNKMTVQSQIRRYLDTMPSDELCAVMILDIDNFKEINDGMGHLFGDAILSDAARRMKHVCRHTDILGRIGGDEFIVFLKDMHDLTNVEKGAWKMIREMYEIQAGHDGKAAVSCSIGISLAPQDGRDFTTLFQKADRALYQAKNEGKNRYFIYDENTAGEYPRNARPRSVVSETIDSNTGGTTQNTRLAEYVFHILYDSGEIKNAVSSILEIVGQQYDVSRVYIFENTENDRCCANTYEWCNEGVEPQKDKLSCVSYEDKLSGNYLDNFNEEGIFYCPDIRTLPKYYYDILASQGIKSLLQCAIRDNGVIKGYVGFDECRQNRYWTREQIDALVFISEILSIFLMKDRVKDALKQESEGLLNLLNNQSAWIYVIDPGTHRLLFINKRTKEFCENADIGLPCYEVFMRRDRPCPSCPMRELSKTCVNKKLEIYNPRFQIWTAAEACLVAWKGEEAVMVSCHDITAYKNAEQD